jgi:hypothetical protein
VADFCTGIQAPPHPKIWGLASKSKIPDPDFLENPAEVLGHRPRASLPISGARSSVPKRTPQPPKEPHPPGVTHPPPFLPMRSHSEPSQRPVSRQEVLGWKRRVALRPRSSATGTNESGVGSRRVPPTVATALHLPHPTRCANTVCHTPHPSSSAAAPRRYRYWPRRAPAGPSPLPGPHWAPAPCHDTAARGGRSFCAQRRRSDRRQRRWLRAARPPSARAARGASNPRPRGRRGRRRARRPRALSSRGAARCGRNR